MKEQTISTRHKPVQLVTFHVAFILACVSSSALSNETDRSDGRPDAMRVFHFGNSLTGSSRPEMHAELARTAGKTWTNRVFAGAGWQTWQHRNELFRAIGRPLGDSVMSLQSRGDLTIDLKPGETPAHHLRPYLEQDWDAVVIQIFGSSKDRRTDEMWGNKWDEPVNIGDVAAAGDIIHHFLRKNQQGRVFIYTVWPNMQPGRQLPPDDELPEWALRMRERTGTIRLAEFPARKNFDFEKVWSSPYMGDHEKPWTLADYPHWRTRDYTGQVFEGIKENFPELWESGRLHHLPGGELFSRLNRRMEAGEFPGIGTIDDFYTDVQHIRAGAANYSIAALFYAGIFRERPDGLNYAMYNDQERYGEDPHNDFGKVIEITPERASVIHDTVWELLREHPHANLNLAD